MIILRTKGTVGRGWFKRTGRDDVQTSDQGSFWARRQIGKVLMRETVHTRVMLGARRNMGGLLSSGAAITDESGRGWIDLPQITEHLTQAYLRQRGKEVPY